MPLPGGSTGGDYGAPPRLSASWAVCYPGRMTMLYRPFGRTGEQVSILGFGAMRLPVIDGRRERIDVPLATEMLHYALDHGVNYVDTAFPYHGASFRRHSGQQRGFRRARRWPGATGTRCSWPPSCRTGWSKSREDMDRHPGRAAPAPRGPTASTAICMHGMGAKPWEKLTRFGVLDFLEAAKADGRIRYAGFSYHDDRRPSPPSSTATTGISARSSTTTWTSSTRRAPPVWRTPPSKGLAVVVMEPLKGGRLAPPVPAPIQAIWDGYPVKRSPVEWALRFVWDDRAGEPAAERHEHHGAGGGQRGAGLAAAKPAR